MRGILFYVLVISFFGIILLSGRAMCAPPPYLHEQNADCINSYPTLQDAAATVGALASSIDAVVLPSRRLSRMGPRPERGTLRRRRGRRRRRRPLPGLPLQRVPGRRNRRRQRMVSLRCNRWAGKWWFRLLRGNETSTSSTSTSTPPSHPLYLFKEGKGPNI